MDTIYKQAADALDEITRADTARRMAAFYVVDCARDHLRKPTPATAEMLRRLITRFDEADAAHAAAIDASRRVGR